MFKRALSCAALSLVFLSQATSGQEMPVFAGLLYSWGVAVPGAAYVDGKWVRLQGPEAFEQHYRAWEWEHRNLWNLKLGGGAERNIEGGPIVRFEDPLLVAWGLITDFPVTSANPNRVPHTIGPIVSHPHRLIGVGQISEGYPVYRDAAEALPSLIQDWEEPSSFVIKEAYWISGSKLADDWVYFKAERWGDDPRCPSAQRLEGWIRDPSGDSVLEQSSRGFSDCDGKGSDVATPLGVLELGDRSFVILNVVGWESRRMDIVELSSAGVFPILSN